MGNKLQNFVRTIPILKGLPDCSIENHRDAFTEVGIKVVFSTLPIWYSVIYLWLKSNSFTQSIQAVIGQGELFMYCTSVLAPIYYMVHKDLGGIKNLGKPGSHVFPGGLAHIVLVSLIISLCSFLFGLFRGDPTLKSANSIFMSSLVLYFFSLVIIYLSTVYSNSRPRFDAILSEDEKEFTEELGARHQ